LQAETFNKFVDGRAGMGWANARAGEGARSSNEVTASQIDFARPDRIDSLPTR
jgi:hypothetical protein